MPAILSVTVTLLGPCTWTFPECPQVEHLEPSAPQKGTVWPVVTTFPGKDPLERDGLSHPPQAGNPSSSPAPRVLLALSTGLWAREVGLVLELPHP